MQYKYAHAFSLKLISLLLLKRLRFQTFLRIALRQALRPKSLPNPSLHTAHPRLLDKQQQVQQGFCITSKSKVLSQQRFITTKLVQVRSNLTTMVPPTQFKQRPLQPFRQHRMKCTERLFQKPAVPCPAHWSTQQLKTPTIKIRPDQATFCQPNPVLTEHSVLTWEIPERQP